MRHYETVFLISPNLTEEETEGIINQMAEIISKKKGKMINKEEWGKRKLAYPIQKFDEAFYVLFQYEGKPEIPVELERQFKQSDAVIRYLTVKIEARENIRRKRIKVAAEEPAVVEIESTQEESPEGEEVKEE